jgi:hypothetical protein
MASWQAWKNRCGAALWLGVASTGALAADPTLTVVATPNPVTVGSPLSMDVLISGIADLYAYQFSLSFDPTVLQAVAATEGGFLLGGGSTAFGVASIDNVAGSISYAYDSLIGSVPGVSGSGVLASFSFTPTAAGVSTLAFADVIFLNSAYGDITVQASSGSVQVVSSVPEPASYALFGLGLAGLAVAAQRRARAAA